MKKKIKKNIPIIGIAKVSKSDIVDAYFERHLTGPWESPKYCSEDDWDGDDEGGLWEQHEHDIYWTILSCYGFAPDEIILVVEPNESCIRDSEEWFYHCEVFPPPPIKKHTIKVWCLE